MKGIGMLKKQNRLPTDKSNRIEQNLDLSLFLYIIFLN